MPGPQKTPTTSGRKLDLHTHYYPPIYFDKIRELPSEFTFAKSPSGQTIITYRGARFFGVTPPMTDVSQRLDDMDRVGIDVEALRELHRAIDELKLNGVILLSNIGGKPLTTPEYRPFFAEANRMKLCILLHPMLPANAEPFREYVLGPIVGFMFDTTLAVARMCFDGLLREFPDIRWIVAHLGGAVPYLMERMDNGWRDFPECRAKIDELPSIYLKRLYYDTVNFNPHMLGMVHEMIGADRMVLGSDYPHLLGSIDRAVSSIESLQISDEDKRQIFEGTALSILNNA